MESIEQYFDTAWIVDPLRTLKFVFYLRDCRGGKGEKKLFRALIRHMIARGLSAHVIANLQQIPFFGSWKDIAICFFGSPLEAEAVALFGSQLQADLGTEHPSLCAKYVPSEGSSIDRAHQTVDKITLALGMTGPLPSRACRFRKQWLRPLRTQLDLVEARMCAKDWPAINYEHVPSIAGAKYKQAFRKHDPDRYGTYLQSVIKGEKKMNTSVLMPYQMVGTYLRTSERDETIEAQWVSFLKDRRSKWPPGINVLPLIDVSGSMFHSGTFPQPGEVAISLGMLFASLNTSAQFKQKFITFHESPELLTISPGTLYDQVKYVQSTKWGGSTNFQSAFDLILNTAQLFAVPEAQMPQILLVLSDMQFNSADNVTNWEAVETKYAAAGYRRPTIIFWNLNGQTVDYPVPNATVPDCALLSGYNDAIMYSLLEARMPSPVEIMHRALDSDRYAGIKLA